MIYGGQDEDGMLLDDTWQLSLAGLTGVPTWTQLSVSGPPPAYVSREAMLDPARSRMLIFISPTEIWSLNLTGSPNWTQLAIDGATSDTDIWAPIYDPVRDRVVTERDRLATTQHVVETALTWSLHFGMPSGVFVPSGASLSLQGRLASGRLVATFTLPTGEPARLAAYDVSGRLIVARNVGSLGAGQHALDLSDGLRVPAGVYYLGLVQGRNRATARVVLLR